jgi:two-component system, NtrC family, sensor kinase
VSSGTNGNELVPGGGLGFGLELDDRALERLVVQAVDAALDGPPRQVVPAGTVLLREGEEVRGISIVLDGRIELLRSTPRGEVVLHAASAGRVIGLMALTRQRRAFFTCRAVSRVTTLPLSFEQLDRALHANPELPGHFINLLLRSAVRRHQRSVELQLQVDELNHELQSERDQLALALARLKAAHLRLVESEKMATLGQMSAGLAHELNNPVVALERAVAHLSDDLAPLVPPLPTLEGLAGPHVSATASERRSQRRVLTDAVGDRALADRFLAAGLTEPAACRALVEEHDAAELDALLTTLEQRAKVEEALATIGSAAERVAGLVRSLRSYARPGGHVVDEVDVREGLDDTLRLLAHRLDDVEVVRVYEEVPPLQAAPGELNQVWTNLVVNAIDAMGGRGRLIVAARRGPDGEAVVEITDSGPGIPPEDQERLFEPHFTTKNGRVEFGLGLGLMVSRRIVDRHGGTIAVDSTPGHTAFTVTLPPSVTAHPRPTDPTSEAP